MPSLHPNQRLRVNGIEYQCTRMLSADTWLLTNIQNFKPYELTTADYLKGFSEGTINFLSDDQVAAPGYNPSLACFGAIAKKAQDDASRKLDYVLSINKLEYGRTVKMVIDAIAQVAKRKNEEAPHVSLVYRWERKWLPTRDVRALVSNTYKGGPRAKRLPGIVLRLIDDIIESKYLTSSRLSIKHVHGYIKDAIKGLNAQRAGDAQLPVPCAATVGRKVKEVDPYDVLVARHGKKYADRNYRVYGRGPVTSRPLQRVEVDHTTLDIIVMCGITGVALGRPTLTIALDHYSRMVVGIYLGFEVPSALSVALCMRHAILPKTYMKERWEDIQNDWGTWGTWANAVFDNGAEFHSAAILAVCKTLGINVHFMPAGTPHYKGSVERFIRTIQDDLIHILPGSTGSNPDDRGERKSEKEAAITMEELLELIHRWIVDVYHVRKHRSLGDTPANVWARGVEQYPLNNPQHVSDLDALKGGVETRAINTYGIELNSLKYSDPKALSELVRKPGAPERFEVRYDPSDLGSIQVLDHETLRPIKVPAVREDYARGLTLYRHVINKRHTKVNGGDTENVDELIRTQSLLIDRANEAVLKKRRLRKTLGKDVARYLGIGVRTVGEPDYVTLAANQCTADPVNANFPQAASVATSSPSSSMIQQNSGSQFASHDDPEADDLLEDAVNEFSKGIKFND